MVRSKIKLAYIEDENARKVTYKKRANGLIKKSEELSTLCGVDVCTIVNGPYNPRQAVWPPEEDKARKIIQRYEEHSDSDQEERKLDQESYLRLSITKDEKKMERLQTRNRGHEMKNLMADLLIGKPVEQVLFNDVEDLLWNIDDRLRSIKHEKSNREARGNAANPTVAANQDQAVPSNTFEAQAGPSHHAGPSNPFERQTGPSNRF